MAIKYLSSANIKNKTVLVRADVNVPIEGGKVGDDYRIQEILPTIKLLRENGNKIILCGHLGRPKGKWDEKYTLLPVAERLAKMLDLSWMKTDRNPGKAARPRLIFFDGKIIGDKYQKIIQNIESRDIVLLENLRFYSGEEDSDPVFSKKISQLADAYVNDAFGVDHRVAASVVGVTKYLPSYAGLLLEREIKSLDAVLHQAKSPFVVMMGGIKISDKVETLTNLAKKADKILVGGGIANLFFLAKEYNIGASKVEVEAVKTAWELARNLKDRLMLPEDVVVAGRQMDKNSIRVAKPYEIKNDEMILDIGPKTILKFAGELKKAKTIVWNGPLGFFEKKPFDTGTIALSRIVGAVSTRKAFGVVGGGETVDAVRSSHQAGHIDHISTGGGAMLEYLAGKKLPGIEALK